jgi:hypothetical protein
MISSFSSIVWLKVAHQMDEEMPYFPHF